MFRSDARRLGFQPEEGMKVVVRCRVTLYERDGAFQVYVNDMFPDGIGSTQLAFEQLKAKLDKEGLFAPEHKKPLPRFPQCIGLVTSKTGAALQDIRNVIGRRWPAVRLLLASVNVQGFEAAEEIADAITRLDKSGRVDEIIVARGGGSREDLWVFNAEVIARAAYRCKTPSSAPLVTRSILRSWILWQISARPHPQRRQSLLCPTVPNKDGNYALWKKIFTIVSNLS